MISSVYKWLNRKYPQNFIIAKPFIGSLIIVLFCLAFILLYRPLNSHPGESLSYEQTMIVYCASMVIPIVLLVWIIKKIRFFSKKRGVTILKEFVSIVIILLGIGTAVYFVAFLVEEPAERWNLGTYWDSCLNAFLVCVIPFTYFSLRNYRLSFPRDTNVYYNERIEYLKQDTKEENYYKL